jgi:hypothetical protein
MKTRTAIACAVATIGLAAATARADFSHTLSTGDYASVNDANGLAVFGPTAAYLGESPGVPGFLPVAVFDAAGTPTTITAATLAWAAPAGSTPAGLDVVAYARADGSLVTFDDAHPDGAGRPTTDLGPLSAAGTVDITAFLTALLAGGGAFPTFVVRAAPGTSGILGPPTLTIAAGSDWTPAPPLPGPKAVPEPATLVLLATGLAGALAGRRRPGS